VSWRERLFLWGPPVALAVVGTLLASLKAPPGASIFWDKAVHAAGYCVLSLLALRATHGGFVAPRLAPSAWAALLTSAHGIGIEIMQSHIPWREGSVGDAVADVVGVMAGLAATWCWFAFKQEER
jgi:VanZ family protein